MIDDSSHVFDPDQLLMFFLCGFEKKSYSWELVSAALRGQSFYGNGTKNKGIFFFKLFGTAFTIEWRP
jgi:hypothetical protein